MRESTDDITMSRDSIRPQTVAAALHDVTVTFDDYQTRALTHVSLEVRRGEVFGLIGPAGSGKTTALKLLAGRLSPMDGKVKVFGSSPRWSWMKSRMGYLPEAMNNKKPQHAGGFFSFVSRLLAWKTRQNDDALLRMPRQTAFQRVVMRNPDLLILDAPFSNVDALTSQEMKKQIRALAERGKTIIFTGNHLADAKDLCDRTAVIHEGKIQAVGTFNDLLSATDSLRFLTLVLSEPARERILNLIREDMTSGTLSNDVSNGPAAKTAPVDSKPESEPQPQITPAEATLARLLKQSTSTSSPEEVSSDQAPDSVDHEALAKLTKPTSADS
jgi:ABC-2 type transport system ATP-binding protein